MAAEIRTTLSLAAVAMAAGLGAFAIITGKPLQIVLGVAVIYAALWYVTTIQELGTSAHNDSTPDGIDELRVLWAASDDHQRTSLTPSQVAAIALATCVLVAFAAVAIVAFLAYAMEPFLRAI
jgi:hypothetical protein